MKDIFKDKVAIITGGASGIGRGLCEEISKQGAIVIVTDIMGEKAKDVADKITSKGFRARSEILDVTNKDNVFDLIIKIKKEHGRLDYLFNNAGITIGGEVRDMTIQQWYKIIDIDLMGAIYGTLAAYPIMIKQHSGHIVNIASVYGLVSLPLTTAYNTTKFGLVGFSNSLRAEAAGLGVKVSIICPGFIKTNLIDNGVMVGFSHDELHSVLDFLHMDLNKAVKKILKSVQKNKSPAVFPLHAKFLWLCMRYFPLFINISAWIIMKVFRKHYRKD